VLACLSRYTHRVAISNSRLIGSDDSGVTFGWKDYCARGKAEGEGWLKTMTLEGRVHPPLPDPRAAERLPPHPPLRPVGERHQGRLHRPRPGAAHRSDPRNGSNARVRDGEPDDVVHPCPCCGGRMIVIETFERGCVPRSRPTAAFRIDSS